MTQGNYATLRFDLAHTQRFVSVTCHAFQHLMLQLGMNEDGVGVIVTQRFNTLPCRPVASFFLDRRQELFDVGFPESFAKGSYGPRLSLPDLSCLACRKALQKDCQLLHPLLEDGHHHCFHLCLIPVIFFQLLHIFLPCCCC